MGVSNECMVVNLQVGLWQGYRLDKAASAQVTEDNNAESDAARVNKHLIPKTVLAPIGQAANAVRRHVYDSTLPWKDNGDRLLPRKMYGPFLQQHEKLVGLFHVEVGDFLERTYLEARDRAQFRMGDLFNETDYPSAGELSRRFYIHLDIEPVAEAGDFRVAMDKQDVESVKSALETATEARVQRAVGEVWQRLAKVVSHFGARMDDGGKFKSTTVTNMHELVEIIPALNFTNDPEMDRIADEIKSHLMIYSTEDLRKDEASRSAAANDAKRIMEDMQGFMTAFTGGQASGS